MTLDIFLDNTFSWNLRNGSDAIGYVKPIYVSCDVTPAVPCPFEIQHSLSLTQQFLRKRTMFWTSLVAVSLLGETSVLLLRSTIKTERQQNRVMKRTTMTAVTRMSVMSFQRVPYLSANRCLRLANWCFTCTSRFRAPNTLTLCNKKMKR